MASAEPSLQSPVAAAPAPATRRRLASRFSAGHVVMIVAALVAALLNYSALRARDDSVRIAVAARDIPAGVPVGLDALRFVDARVDAEVLAALLGPEQAAGVDGWVAATTLAAGEPVRASDLRAPSAPEAQRAMSVPIDPEHAVGGALRRGDRVDVITVRDGAASYLVTDAEVLAVPDSGSRGGLGTLSRFSVTLAVDEEIALRLAEALRAGALEVVRSTGARAVPEDVAPAAGGPGQGGSAQEAAP